MADLVVIPDNVIPSPYAGRNFPVTYGTDITQGMPVYLNGTDNGYAYPTSAISGPSADAVGIAMLAGGRGQNGYYIQSDPNLNIGASPVNGIVYCVSVSAGKICPVLDLGSGDFITVIGTTNALGNLNFSIVSGVAK